MVGAVAAKGRAEIGRAFRSERGEGDHAEFWLLDKKLQSHSLAGTTIYTTLEPCTPRARSSGQISCTTRLLDRKVERVVIGILDPNPLVCGQGVTELRKAGIKIDFFGHEEMRELEDLNREFLRSVYQKTASTDTSPIDKNLAGMIQSSGLVALYSTRDDYTKYRTEGGSIDKFVCSASSTATMVSINLMTGVPFDGLLEAVRRKILDTPKFMFTVSLLDPDHSELMSAAASILSTPSPVSPSALAIDIRRTLEGLSNFRKSLTNDHAQNVGIRVHRSLPFGSAIILDHGQANGRIQVESKPYKARIRDSFALTFKKSHDSVLYDNLVGGYLSLIGDGEAL